MAASDAPAEMDRAGRCGGRLGHQPDLARAATDLVQLVVFFVGERRQGLAKVDEVREARFPVAEEGKIFAELFSLLGDGHAA